MAAHPDYLPANYNVPTIGKLVPCPSRYEAQPGEYKKLLASVHFASTGQFATDLIWAYGIAVVRFNPATKETRVVDRRRRIIKIKREVGETDEQLWLRMGWEMECLKEYYHRFEWDPVLKKETSEQKNLAGFNALQKIATVRATPELAVLLNHDLHDIESEAALCNGTNPKDGSPLDFQYAWCAADFHRTAASVLLGKIGAVSMRSWRNGSGNGDAYDFYSYLCGMSGVNMGDANWTNMSYLMSAINEQAKQIVHPDHDPLNHAIYTCARIFLVGLLSKKPQTQEQEDTVSLRGIALPR